jgi:ribosomal 30S subunit maturation factor RimM
MIETRQRRCGDAGYSCQSDRPVLGEDEYHVLDLIGLEVFNQLTGENIGTVVDIIPAGNDLLEVQLHQMPTPSQQSSQRISLLKQSIHVLRNVNLNQNA